MKAHWTIVIIIAASVSAAATSGSAVVTGWNAAIAASNPLDWYQFNELSGSTLID